VRAGRAIALRRAAIRALEDISNGGIGTRFLHRGFRTGSVTDVLTELDPLVSILLFPRWSCDSTLQTFTFCRSHRREPGRQPQVLCTHGFSSGGAKGAHLASIEFVFCPVFAVVFAGPRGRAVSGVGPSAVAQYGHSLKISSYKPSYWCCIYILPTTDSMLRLVFDNAPIKGGVDFSRRTAIDGS